MTEDEESSFILIGVDGWFVDIEFFKKCSTVKFAEFLTVSKLPMDMKNILQNQIIHKNFFKCCRLIFWMTNF